MCNNPNCSYCSYKWTGKKLLVIACAGQSNSVGYAESFNYTVPNAEGLYQLGLYAEHNLKVIPLTTTPENLQNMKNRTIDPKYPHANVIKTDKTSYHLQLAYRLREAMDEEYDVLVVPVAYGGTRFSGGNDAEFDECKRTSVGVMQPFTWEAGKIFSKILASRIKFAVNLHPDNIFGGIVWLQGEHDSTSEAAVNSHPKYFEDFVYYIERELQEIKNKSIFFNANKKEFSVGKEVWFTPTTVEYWYKSARFERISNNSYVKLLGEKHRILLPFDNQYTNANGGDGQTSSTRNSHFRNMQVVGNGIADSLLKTYEFNLPARVWDKYHNNKQDLSTFIDLIQPNSCHALSVKTNGEVWCNPSTANNTQVMLWLNKEVKGFLIDNNETKTPFFLLVKNINEEVYAFVISDTPNKEGHYWNFYKVSFGNNNGGIYPITLTQVGNTADNNFKNLYSVCRCSTGELSNFPAKRNEEYGFTINRYGQLIIINGKKSNNLIVRDNNQMVIANDYCYVPVGNNNLNMFDSILYKVNELERIGNFIDSTTNKSVDVSIKPIQFGILTLAPQGNSTNAIKIGKLKNIYLEPCEFNYF